MRTVPLSPETSAGAGTAVPVTSPALEALAAAVEKYLASGVPGSEAEVGGDRLAVGVLIERLEASRVKLLSELDRSGAYLAEGAVSAASWLRARTGMGRGAVHDRVVLARRLPEMPATSRAFAAGEISHAHARVLASALAPDTDTAAREQFLESEPAFVDAARVTTPQELRKIIERYVLDLAGDDGVARSEALHARRPPPRLPHLRRHGRRRLPPRPRERRVPPHRPGGAHERRSRRARSDSPHAGTAPRRRPHRCHARLPRRRRAHDNRR